MEGVQGWCNLQCVYVKLPLVPEFLGFLCSAVSEGDLALLRRMLHAGADPNIGDYDKRTALHVAAADCNLPVVSARGRGLGPAVVCVTGSECVLRGLWGQQGVGACDWASALVCVVRHVRGKLVIIEAYRTALHAGADLNTRRLLYAPSSPHCSCQLQPPVVSARVVDLWKGSAGALGPAVVRVSLDRVCQTSFQGAKS
jgi:hypothetical protein